MKRSLVALLATLIVVSGCADLRPNSVVSPQLDSGITSSNGGGERALGNQLNFGISTPSGTLL